MTAEQKSDYKHEYPPLNYEVRRAIEKAIIGESLRGGQEIDGRMEVTVDVALDKYFADTFCRGKRFFSWSMLFPVHDPQFNDCGKNVIDAASNALYDMCVQQIYSYCGFNGFPSQEIWEKFMKWTSNKEANEVFRENIPGQREAYERLRARGDIT